jgi:hypothetical protein
MFDFVAVAGQRHATTNCRKRAYRIARVPLNIHMVLATVGAEYARAAQGLRPLSRSVEGLLDSTGVDDRPSIELDAGAHRAGARFGKKVRPVARVLGAVDEHDRSLAVDDNDCVRPCFEGTAKAGIERSLVLQFLQLRDVLLTYGDKGSAPG